MDGLPRPPPPVYQPEIVADAIHFAAINRRRDLQIGGQTVQIALLNQLAPALADRLLATFGPRTMKSSNQGIADGHDANLFSASTRVSSTHGPFDKESVSMSPQLWANKNRPGVGAALTFGIALFGLMVAGRRQ